MEVHHRSGHDPQPASVEGATWLPPGRLDSLNDIPQRGEISQTLDRGLHALELVAASPNGSTINEIATALNLNRTVVYRLLTTLAKHRLISRDEEGRYWPATGILDFAKLLVPRLRQVATPHLRQLAITTGATAHLTIADGEEAVAVAVFEPRSSIHVAYRVGSRHPLRVGAAGIAILAARPPAKNDSDAVRDARRRGYAATAGELQTGAVGVAAPIPGADRAEEASIGLVALSGLAVEEAAVQIVATAEAVADGLRLLEPL